MTSSDLLDEKGAAAHVGMSRWFLRRARMTGRGPAFIKIGRSVRYAKRDLDAWLDRQRMALAAPPATTVLISGN